jgi:hypothetical protein
MIMCIIVYKPKGQKLPDRDILRECWDCNSQGAGFASSDGVVVTAHKGYMKFKKFYRALKMVDSVERDVVMHFRIGTSGLRDETATHPFPISNNEENMQMKHYTTEGWVAFHNGIISGYGNALWSDTQRFVMDELSELVNVIGEPVIQRLILKATGSKWALMSPTKVILLGAFNEKDGIHYSNYSYIKVARSYGGYTSAGYGYMNNWDKDWNDNWVRMPNGTLRHIDTITAKEMEELDDLDALDPLDETDALDDVKYIRGSRETGEPYFSLDGEDLEYCQRLGQNGMCDACDYLMPGPSCSLASTFDYHHKQSEGMVIHE